MVIGKSGILFQNWNVKWWGLQVKTPSQEICKYKCWNKKSKSYTMGGCYVDIHKVAVKLLKWVVCVSRFVTWMSVSRGVPVLHLLFAILT